MPLQIWRSRWLVCSLGIHLVVVAAMLFTPEHSPETETPLLIEIQTQQASHSKKVLAPRPSARMEQPKPPPETTSEASSLPEAPPTQKMGHSDLGDELSAANESNLSPRQLYLARLRTRIQNQQIYPRASKMLREQGTVRIRVLLAKSGHLEELHLLLSSQFPRLDDAAMKAIAKAAPFDPFPSDVPFDSWEITVPVRFQLN